MPGVEPLEKILDAGLVATDIIFGSSGLKSRVTRFVANSVQTRQLAERPIQPANSIYPGLLLISWMHL